MANNNDAELPVIPLSPIVQSYIISTNALNLATEKLAEAKKAGLPVNAFMETQKVESQRLNSLVKKMQTVDAATAIYWDSDSLARQIAVIDSHLFNKAILLDKQTNLDHLVDFNIYLTHSFAHQLIYWVELLNNPTAAGIVVPTVNPNKDSLVTHLLRVAYLLLHAYRDFSGFAAIMKALTLPQVKRLEKKLWHNCSSRTKDMFKELLHFISPEKNYHAYQTSIRTKLDMYRQSANEAMIAIPWVQPHLLFIRSIIEEYTAGDGDDIVLSTPGAHKLDMEISFLELCQHSSFSSDFSLREILTANGMYETTTVHKRASTKAIHIEGLRSAVIPVANLTHLAPGEQLIHHWLVSRAYLSNDQLVEESIQVEPLNPGEVILCEPSIPFKYHRPVTQQPYTKEQNDTITNTNSVEADAKTNTQNDTEADTKTDDTDKVEVDTKNDTKNEDNLKEDTKKEELTITIFKSVVSSSKSRLSPSAPEFIPKKLASSIASSSTDSEQWLGYPIRDTDSEQWYGYPVPSSRSSTSEEWKGYQATKMEADWQRESALKLQQYKNEL